MSQSKIIFMRLWHSPTLTTWASLASRILGMTLVLPMVLTRFGEGEVAVWQLFISIYTMQMMFDFGLSPSLSRLFAYARSGQTGTPRCQLNSAPFGEIEFLTEPSEVMATQRWLYRRIGFIAAIIVGIFGTYFLKVPIGYLENQNAGWAAWWIVLGTSLIGFWGAGYSAALQGMNHIAVARRWEILFSLFQITSSVLVLLIDGELLALVISNQFWLAIGAIRNRMIIKGLHPEIFEKTPKIYARVLKMLWPAAWRSGLGVIFSQGLIQASGLIYSQVAEPAQVAPYLLALRFVTLVSQFSQAPFYSKLPVMATLYSQGKQKIILDIAARGMRQSLSVYVAGVTIVGLCARYFLHIMTSGTDFVSNQMWILISVAFFVERWGAMYLQLYSTTNNIVWHIANGITGVLMIAFSFILYPYLDIVAFPCSMIVSYLAFYVWYSIRNASRAFHFKWFEFERQCAVPPALAGLIIVLAYQLSAVAPK